MFDFFTKNTTELQLGQKLGIVGRIPLVFHSVLFVADGECDLVLLTCSLERSCSEMEDRVEVRAVLRPLLGLQP